MLSSGPSGIKMDFEGKNECCLYQTIKGVFNICSDKQTVLRQTIFIKDVLFLKHDLL